LRAPHRSHEQLRDARHNASSDSSEAVRESRPEVVVLMTSGAFKPLLLKLVIKAEHGNTLSNSCRQRYN
jgi:hypothetical protein